LTMLLLPSSFFAMVFLRTLLVAVVDRYSLFG
jgi:hypothetical protein